MAPLGPIPRASRNAAARSCSRELAPESRDHVPEHALVHVQPVIPQATFAEAKTAAMALADGPSMRRWSPVDGELALCHVVPNWPLQTKVVGGPLLDWLHLPADAESLTRELQAAGLTAVLAWHICIGLALEHAQVTVALDELIAAIGWNPHSTAERERMRSTWWRWIALFDSAQVIGKRPGQYRDARTRRILDLLSIDALIRITGRRLPAQLGFDESVPPSEVSFVAGPWLDQYRGNHQVLTYFGDIRRLAAIPAGKPSGAWAQAIGLALHQLWRERSATVRIVRVGEDKHQTPQFAPVTTKQLLDMFPPSPTVYEVLDGPHPKRAQLYWNEAVQLLRVAGIIGSYRQRSRVRAVRQGWREDWLNQPLDIRPTEAGTEAAAEIGRRAKSARRAHVQRRPVAPRAAS
jgi:hypothetical protein